MLRQKRQKTPYENAAIIMIEYNTHLSIADPYCPHRPTSLPGLEIANGEVIPGK